ncbi:OmpA family protein [Cystobacter fuscus]|uniref:OmpA family protein n=1 Tax=Cystobacter fuscus TaxID=43 RepID=UPI0037C045B9
MLTVGLLLVARPVGAQGVALERMELSPGAAGSLLLGTGELLPEGALRLSTVGHYQHNPYVLSRGGAVTQIVGNRLTTHLAAAYSLTNWLELEAQLPVVALQRGEDLVDKGIEPPVRYGLSTPTVGARWGLLSQRAERWADLALGLNVGLPFGNASGLPGEAGAHVTPQLMFGRRFGWFRLALEARALLRKKSLPPADSTVGRSEVGSELRFGAVAATVGRRLRWELNVVGTVPLVNQPRSLELLLGPRYLLNPSTELFALGGVGVGIAPGTPLFRVMVGSAFGGVTPPRLKGESSVNCSMGLSHTAEECPDLDDDKDGVRNEVDKCPDKPGTLERNGCPPQDSDGDGVEDALDECPKEWGEWRGGCPMPDEDKDGVDDERDSCPTLAGPPETRGCPRSDQDGDGVEDDVDLCPKQEGEPKLQGCPEADRDGDTLANRFDSCPDLPGLLTNHGCPKYEVPLVEITPTQLKLTSKVYFLTDSSRLDSRSNEQLNWVVKVIKEHPEIQNISIGAHTDDRGFPNANLQLSLERARAVRQYLIHEGVAPEQLEARGFGGTQPIADNQLSIGREANRRVEFSIIWRE